MFFLFSLTDESGLGMIDKKNFIGNGEKIQMSRRNVLGNQIEGSKTMWIVLIGILVTVLQFGIYYFIGEGFLGMLFAGIGVLAGGIFVHFIMEEQEELFSYLLIPCIFSGVLGLVLPYVSGDFLPESKTVFMFSLMSWLLVVLYAVIYTLLNGVFEMKTFTDFYKKAMIFFYLVYFIVLGYMVIWEKENIVEGELKLLPLDTFVTYIEQLIKGQDVVAEFLLFLQNRFVFFIPFGFLVGMLGRNLLPLLRFIFIFLFSIMLEGIRFFISEGAGDIDHVIFGFLGALIGMVIFLGFNELFCYFVGKNFDGSDINRDYYGRKI